MFGRLQAFVRRDLQITASYKLNVGLMGVTGAMSLTLLFFLARTMGEVPLLRQRYGTGYFGFALVGVAVAQALRAMQTSFAMRLRETQADGSLEVLFSTPLRTVEVVSYLAAFPLAFALLSASLLVAAGGWLFGAELHVAPLSFVLTLLFAALPFTALGLLSAAFVLVFKRGDPFTYAMDVASYLLAGILYPVEVMPAALRALARFLPTTYAVNALRAATLRHAPPRELLESWATLALFGALLWPLAALALRAARAHVERTGTLPQA